MLFDKIQFSNTEQLEKTYFPMVVTELGITIDSILLPLKADSPIDFRLLGNSRLCILQFWKALFPIETIELGKVILLILQH